MFECASKQIRFCYAIAAYILMNNSSFMSSEYIADSLLFTAVGKTSVVMRCVRDMFDKEVGSTIGAAFFTYKM